MKPITKSPPLGKPLTATRWLIHIFPEKIARKKQHAAKAIQCLRLLSLVTAALMLITSGCKKVAPPPPPPPTVMVMDIAATNVPMRAPSSSGNWTSPQNVEVRARVEAFVDKVLFTEAHRGEGGSAPLFALDKKPFEERLRRRQRDAGRGESVALNNASNRTSPDSNRSRRSAPFHSRTSTTPSPSVDVGKANVLSAEARVVSAKLDLGYCGCERATRRHDRAKQVSVGSLVGKGEPTLLATISRNSTRIWFYCNIGEAQYLKAEAEARRSGRKVADLSMALLGRRLGSSRPRQVCLH